MALLTESLWIDLTLVISTLILSVLTFFNERYKYWRRLGVPYVEPLPLFGSLKDNALGKENIMETHCKIYNKLRGERFGGFFEFHTPNLMIMDPELVYRVLVKDFAHFHDRGMFPSDPVHDPLSNTISQLTGQEWRKLRYKLSPAFTSGKLKGMIEQISNSGENLLREMDKLATNKQDVDCRELVSEFTIDVIASCAFGLQFNLDTPEGKKFKTMAFNALPQSRLTFLIMLVRNNWTKLANILGLTTFTKEVTQYFVNLSKETVKFRKQHGIDRNDFLQLLLNLKDDEGREENQSDSQEADNADDDVINQLKSSSVYSKDLQKIKVMTDECLAATSFLFLVAGMEVSTVLVYVIYCLATNPRVQEKLQQETDQVLAKHQTLNHLALKDMVYLDKVLCETLRMYPIGSFLSRVCTIPYRIPDTDITLQEGTRITIPVWAIHHDPKYYPDPDVFDPERFPAPDYKPTPTWMPFGDGPRICIAMRFAILEMKVCIARIMSQYIITLSKETKLPITFEPKGIMPKIRGGIKISLQKKQ